MSTRLSADGRDWTSRIAFWMMLSTFITRVAVPACAMEPQSGTPLAAQRSNGCRPTVVNPLESSDLNCACMLSYLRARWYWKYFHSERRPIPCTRPRVRCELVSYSSSFLYAVASCQPSCLVLDSLCEMFRRLWFSNKSERLCPPTRMIFDMPALRRCSKNWSNA